MSTSSPYSQLLVCTADTKAKLRSRFCREVLRKRVGILLPRSWQLVRHESWSIGHTAETHFLLLGFTGLEFPFHCRCLIWSCRKPRSYNLQERIWKRKRGFLRGSMSRFRIKPPRRLIKLFPSLRVISNCLSRLSSSLDERSGMDG